MICRNKHDYINGSKMKMKQELQDRGKTIFFTVIQMFRISWYQCFKTNYHFPISFNYWIWQNMCKITKRLKINMCAEFGGHC